MLLHEEAEAPFLELLSCVEAHEDGSCDDLYEACEEQAEDVAVAVDDVAVDVEARPPPQGGGDPEEAGNNRETLGDDLREAFSGDATGEIPLDPDYTPDAGHSEAPDLSGGVDAGVSAQEPDGESDEASGCSSLGGGHPFSLLLFLPLLAFLRRREP